ncbi:MAG: hypothetical protein B7Z35_11720 [Hydrogenophilales bacterium 12-61-10]|nr:MAG: hypothetical protein B7Z35_11720 [Hydrogenophilales bacterium 12-61-10]
MKLSSLSIAGAWLCLAFNHALAAESHSALHHAPAPDTRSVLALEPDERAMILEEMRMFLDGVHKMTGALAKPDMAAVAEIARGMGQKMVHEVPPALRAKLPQAFRQLGFSVHREFDQIALDAGSLQNVSHSLNQLSATLQKCVSCHASYQIQAPIHADSH